VLLGLLAARPTLLGLILHEPADAGRQLLGGICRRSVETTWPLVLAGLKPCQRGSSWYNDLRAGLDASERDDWCALVSAGEATAARVTLPDLAAFRTWGPHIARFSFLVDTPSRVMTGASL
jgi:hypothetical protein